MPCSCFCTILVGLGYLCLYRVGNLNNSSCAFIRGSCGWMAYSAFFVMDNGAEWPTLVSMKFGWRNHLVFQCKKLTSWTVFAFLCDSFMGQNGFPLLLCKWCHIFNMKLRKMGGILWVRGLSEDLTDHIMESAGINNWNNLNNAKLDDAVTNGIGI